MSTQKRIWSSDPEGLKRANPATLTEAEQAYRQLLLKQDAEKMSRRMGIVGDAQYLRELGTLIADQGVEAPRDSEPAQPAEKPSYANDKDIKRDDIFE